MTQDEIIEMARQVEFEVGFKWCVNFIELEAFAKLVAAKATEEANARANASWTLMCEKMVAFEREACAKVCDEYSATGKIEEFDRGWLACAKNVAAAIRARGEA